MLLKYFKLYQIILFDHSIIWFNGTQYDANLTVSTWPIVILTVVSGETFLCGPPKISVCLVVKRATGLAIFETVSGELLVSASKLDLKWTN